MQGAHDAVDIDPADLRDAPPGDRLPVGDDGQGLQRCLAQACGGAANDELLDEVGVLGHGGETPPTCRTSQEESMSTAAGRLSTVLGCEALEQLFAYALLHTEGLGDRRGGHRLVGDDEDGLSSTAQLRPLRPHSLAHANSSSSSVRFSEVIMPVRSS